MDALGEPSRLLQRLLHVGPISSRSAFACGIGIRRPFDELKVDRERDQVLLHAVVQLAFNPPPVGVGRQHEPLPRRAELV